VKHDEQLNNCLDAKLRTLEVVWTCGVGSFKNTAMICTV